MKLISFTYQGAASYGVLQDEQVLDLGAVFGERAPDLKSYLAQGLDLAQAAQAPRRALAQVTLLPVIPNPGQIFCIGLNYADHVQETGRQSTEHPTIFMRVPESQVAHGQAIVLPPESDRLDYEGEIAIIIGKPGRRIAEADAAAHIAGYACYNDGSVRDPDTSISGTALVRLEVAGGAPSVTNPSFSVTDALGVIGPGKDSPETVTGTPTFRWADDSSEDRYELVVFDAFGNKVWEKLDLPGVSGSAEVAVAYAGAEALKPGMVYQFRATSIRRDVPISRTEQLRGVFSVQ